MSYPQIRPRRLRTTPAMRRLVEETHVLPSQLILPMFVQEGLAEPRPIASLPGVLQHSRESLRKAAAEAVRAGVGGIMLFGVPETRDEVGSGGARPGRHPQRRDPRRDLRGRRRHRGDERPVPGRVHLARPLRRAGAPTVRSTTTRPSTLYAEMAVAQADAGAHVVGPSGMMDGQVGVVRAALDAAGHQDVAILAYAVKFASAFYGPFREAVESALQGDRRTYQQDPANIRESMREVALDVAEGADMVMVKPALPYLDVVSAVAATVDVPVAAYQVSGEYAMVEAAAANGWIDRDRAILETLTSIRRAGASIILTYWAEEAARLLRDRY